MVRPTWASVHAQASRGVTDVWKPSDRSSVNWTVGGGSSANQICGCNRQRRSFQGDLLWSDPPRRAAALRPLQVRRAHLPTGSMAGLDETTSQSSATSTGRSQPRLHGEIVDDSSGVVAEVEGEGPRLPRSSSRMATGRERHADSARHDPVPWPRLPGTPGAGCDGLLTEAIPFRASNGPQTSAGFPHYRTIRHGPAKGDSSRRRPPRGLLGITSTVHQPLAQVCRGAAPLLPRCQPVAGGLSLSHIYRTFAPACRGSSTIESRR